MERKLSKLTEKGYHLENETIIESESDGSLRIVKEKEDPFTENLIKDNKNN